MAIKASEIAALLQPVLTAHFSRVHNPSQWSSLFGVPPPPTFTEEWLEQYEIEYTKIKDIKRQRHWETILSRHTPTVRARIERLNKNGVEEGARIRGTHYKAWDEIAFTRDFVLENSYIKRWGFAPTDIVYRRGRKKYVTRIDYQAGTAHHIEATACPNPRCEENEGHAYPCGLIPF